MTGQPHAPATLVPQITPTVHTTQQNVCTEQSFWTNPVPTYIEPHPSNLSSRAPSVFK
jgi:hypothetical protein